MRIDLINTGTELLIGQTLNTHVQWLGNELLTLGLRLQRQTAIPDGEEIRHALLESIPRCDVILVTGGLGPTSDDITREITAELLKLPLETHPVVMEHIRTYLEQRGREVTPSNARQAQVPRGTRVLPNPYGTAPGLHVPPQPHGPTGTPTPHIFLLPGPPRELYPMWQAEVRPWLEAHLRQAPPLVKNLKFFGVGEAPLAEALEASLLAAGVTEIGYCARPGEVILRLTGPVAALEQATALAHQTFPAELFSEDGATMEEVVVRLLTEQRATVATAESCTGGLVANRLTNVPGASNVFGWGFVSYANEAKEALLGVPHEHLATHGAVSAPVAEAMAEGARSAANADHAIALTGIAGPGGGSAEKPVGTVYVGLASRDRAPEARHEFFPYERDMFKILASQAALDWLRRRLLNLA